MEVWRGNELLRTYPVSTSRFGLGTEEGSFKTPLGSFEICEKHGDEEPLHTIFKERKPAGEWNPDQPPGEEDLILARILRLHGLEEENANSYQRYNYIHGTNHEDRIGTPSSHGCVRMKNSDIAELYDLIPLGSPVQISRT
jgi:lipoprotein-anchoring transpeptidase ErfK/SrfK